jgi:hypothetical protein
VQSCAQGGGCADYVRHVCVEFVGTGNSVRADVCGNVRLCCTHVCFVWGMPGMPTRVCLPVYRAFGCYLVILWGKFVGTGNGVMADVWQCAVVLHPYVLCMGCGWDANPRVPPSILCCRLLFSDGNSASQARGWALDPAPQVHRPVPPA